MRIVKILLFLLTISQVAFATEASLAKILVSLSAEQKTLLYQYGTLNNWATPAEADGFWRQHQPELANISPEDGKLLATELLANTELVYTIKKPSRLVVTADDPDLPVCRSDGGVTSGSCFS